MFHASRYLAMSEAEATGCVLQPWHECQTPVRTPAAACTPSACGLHIFTSATMSAPKVENSYLDAKRSARVSARSYIQRMCSSTSASMSSLACCASKAMSFARSVLCASDLQ
jgi:hypothetical protein